MARRRGWGGHPPSSDDEAAERVISAAVSLIAETGSAITIADVASSLGVIRQTVYRYFPTAEALMHAAAVSLVDGFLDQLAEHVRGIADPAEAMTEGTIYSLETIRNTPGFGILITGTFTENFAGNLASDEAREFGMRMINRFDVDWQAHGYDEVSLRELVEFTLRTMLSFLVAPNDPTRSQDELRRFLRRWLGGAIEAQRPIGRPQGKIVGPTDT
jgi:AcrR family transcriptional regulator